MPTPLYWRRCFFAAVLLMAAMPAALFAQWPSYPTPGVPRTADGKPNLSAPAPKTPDGKPDLTGIWQNDRTVGGTVAARSSANPPSNQRRFIGDRQAEPVLEPRLPVQRRSAVHALGRGTAPATRRRQQQG